MKIQLDMVEMVTPGWTSSIQEVDRRLRQMGIEPATKVGTEEARNIHTLTALAGISTKRNRFTPSMSSTQAPIQSDQKGADHGH